LPASGWTSWDLADKPSVLIIDHLDEVFTLAKQRRQKSLGEHDSLANAQSDGAARSQGDELRPNSFLAAAANQSPLDRAHWLLLKFF
jgi:hypothetical protein